MYFKYRRDPTSSSVPNFFKSKSSYYFLTISMATLSFLDLWFKSTQVFSLSLSQCRVGELGRVDVHSAATNFITLNRFRGGGGGERSTLKDEKNAEEKRGSKQGKEGAEGETAKGGFHIWCPQNFRLFWPPPPPLQTQPCSFGDPFPHGQPTEDVIHGHPQTKGERRFSVLPTSMVASCRIKPSNHLWFNGSAVLYGKNGPLPGQIY